MKLAMKKTYINPSMIVVRLGMTQPIAGSLTTTSATFYDDDAIGDAMVKENVIPDIDIWDNEW